MNLEIAGKTGLVTGASRGIGRGIALALGREGVHLVVTARDGAALERLAQELKDSGASAPVVVEAELMDADAAERLAQAALSAIGHVDILINNAGGSRPFDLDTSEDAWEEALTLNFTRQRQLTQQILPGMIERRWGRVVNITGKSEPEGINGAFCAKAAMHSWAKGLSRDVGPHGITVNCVPPGRIMSAQIERNYTPEYRAWQAEHEIPVGSYGQPEDVANLVCFLASPRARYITGAVIPVDGGLRRYQF